jgi:hypothetical protein
MPRQNDPRTKGRCSGELPPPICRTVLWISGIILIRCRTEAHGKCRRGLTSRKRFLGISGAGLSKPPQPKVYDSPMACLATRPEQQNEHVQQPHTDGGNRCRYLGPAESPTTGCHGRCGITRSLPPSGSHARKPAMFADGPLKRGAAPGDLISRNACHRSGTTCASNLVTLMGTGRVPRCPTMRELAERATGQHRMRGKPKLLCPLMADFVDLVGGQRG